MARVGKLARAFCMRPNQLGSRQGDCWSCEAQGFWDAGELQMTVADEEGLTLFSINHSDCG